ncbi:MAG: hypothetical protein ABIE22_05275 [archaeon]
MRKRLKQVNEALFTKRSFTNEFRTQVRLFIVFTLGFTIAFTWRQTIFDLSFEFIQFITDIKDSAAASLLASVLITIVSLVAIYLASHWLKDEF